VRSGAREVSIGKRVTYLNRKKKCTIGETNVRSEQEHEHLVRENTSRIAVKKNAVWMVCQRSMN